MYDCVVESYCVVPFSTAICTNMKKSDYMTRFPVPFLRCSYPYVFTQPSIHLPKTSSHISGYISTAVKYHRKSMSALFTSPFSSQLSTKPHPIIHISEHLPLLFSAWPSETKRRNPTASPSQPSRRRGRTRPRREIPRQWRIQRRQTRQARYKVGGES